MQIPIITGNGTNIIGWTDTVPVLQGAVLRHPEAERLLGGPIWCVYVEIEDVTDAKRAGAPPEWKGAWRCLAICKDRAGLAAPNRPRGTGASAGAKR